MPLGHETSLLNNRELLLLLFSIFNGFFDVIHRPCITGSNSLFNILSAHMNYKVFSLLLGLMVTSIGQSAAQDNYRNYQEMTDALQNLESEYSDAVSLQSIATSPGGHNIWHITIGSGDIANMPAMAIVGGADGSHILGIEIALNLAEALAEHADSDQLADNQVFHIFPNINPDASEQYFTSVRYERSVNGKNTDLDRDGVNSEDIYDDLNGDGLITMMRVQDATGKWIPHPDDGRVMIEADPLKSQTGLYRLITEGRDNDGDGQFNEDPAGGVNINKNFTYQHPSFKYGAGEFPVSEAENRALADLMFDTFNIYAVLTFSPNNNLSDPWRYSRSGAAKRVITGILEGDEGVYQSVSDLYKNVVPQENASGYSLQAGGFPEWAYFHYARYSFTTDGWWHPTVDASNEQSGNGPSSSELDYLRWADSTGIDVFTDWQQIDHPDFPDRVVEVGGTHPFAMTTPPYSLVDSLTVVHLEFVEQLNAMKADLVFENIRVEDAGRNLTRITVDLHNRGSLPTSTELGTRTQWVRPINVKLTTDDSIQVLSGMPRSQIERLMGGESQKLTWLISGNGSVSLSAGTPSAGFATFEQTIR